MRQPPPRRGAGGVLLLTGFEPFGGDVRNPSLELVQALDGTLIKGCQVVSVVLPCAFGAAPAALAAAISRWQPLLVMAVGQAGGRAELSLERVAINLIDARIADNAGQQPIDEPVVAGGPAAYFSTLPIKAMVQAVREAGVPAGVSHSAGTFVCNQVFYVLQHQLARQDGPADLPATRVPSGFMHVPFLPEQAALRPGGPQAAARPSGPQGAAALPPSLAFNDMLRGLQAALAAAVQGLSAQGGPADLGLALAPRSEGTLD